MRIIATFESTDKRADRPADRPKEWKRKYYDRDITTREQAEEFLSQIIKNGPNHVKLVSFDLVPATGLTFEVLVTASKRVIVTNAADEDEALELASDEISFGDLELDESSIEQEIDGDSAIADFIELAKRHGQPIVHGEELTRKEGE